MKNGAGWEEFWKNRKNEKIIWADGIKILKSEKRFCTNGYIREKRKQKEKY